jgi:hypothetical protein
MELALPPDGLEVGMKTKVLGVALGLGLAMALLAPSTAEARHRHSRGCNHGSRYSSYGYSQNYRYSPSYRYTPSYGYYPSYRYVPPPPPPVAYYDDYSYGGGYYAPRYGYGYSRSPRVAFHYHGGARCSRSHVSLHLGY